MSSWTTRVTNQEEQGGGPSFPVPKPVHKLTEYPRRWRQFLHEVRVEMRQVTWPSRDDVVSTTAVVIATVAFFGLFFLIVDSGVGYAVQQVFKLFQH
jgi:preprotein translocase subunit SecE